MFNWLKNKLDAEPAKAQPKPPEVLGLRLGGAIELDDLKFKIIEPNLIISNASRTQLISAVGVVNLDEQSRLIRYYTDDDGYIQILQQGRTDADIQEVKLWYYYETKPIDTTTQWNNWLQNEVVKPNIQLEGYLFNKVWDNVKPVGMTEQTWDSNGNITTTDQFVMVYEREADSDLFESVLISAEESIIDNRADHCVVYSTGVNLSATDFKVVG
ncbi:YjfK family protein [Aliivibrio kagoshimensis]|uniref:YjfK family protein n=1 Tax=Aliivibrio kagoshimensis TaxID=2910230 RepID=UPI003D0F022A